MNNNPYTAAHRNMRTIEREEQGRATLENIPPKKITAQFIAGPDVRGYNNPTNNEIAKIFIGEDDAPPLHRDIVVYSLLRQKEILYFVPFRSHGVSSAVPE